MADLLTPELPIEGGIADEGIAIEAEAEGPLGSKLSLTAEDIPELSDLQVGDSISFTLDDVTEDGSYSLTVTPIGPATEPIPPGLPAEEPAAGGQEAVLSELIG